jgi:hypothetical protein
MLAHPLARYTFFHGIASPECSQPPQRNNTCKVRRSIFQSAVVYLFYFWPASGPEKKKKKTVVPNDRSEQRDQAIFKKVNRAFNFFKCYPYRMKETDSNPSEGLIVDAQMGASRTTGGLSVWR